jgi:hypothetical protein
MRRGNDNLDIDHNRILHNKVEEEYLRPRFRRQQLHLVTKSEPVDNRLTQLALSTMSSGPEERHLRQTLKWKMIYSLEKQSESAESRLNRCNL